MVKSGGNNVYVYRTDLQVKPHYNGNIAEVLWNTSSPQNTNHEMKIYGYVYDALNRLLAGFYEPYHNKASLEHSEIMTYDLNGNIKTLYRTAYLQNNTPVLIDDLTYDYTPLGNRLYKITDHTNNSSGFEGLSINPITYDANGNMTSFEAKNISKITYNHLNLPKKFLFSLEIP